MQKIVFESQLLDDGHLDCPKEIVIELSRRKEMRITVTVEIGRDVLSHEELGVMEAELQRMMALQGKSREVVVKFLRAAGALAEEAGFEQRVIEARQQGQRWRTPLLS